MTVRFCCARISRTVRSRYAKEGELLGKHRVFRVTILVRLLQNTSHKSEVLRQSFATRKPLGIQGMCPNRETLDFCDAWLWRALRSPQGSKWPLVTGLLGLPQLAKHAGLSETQCAGPTHQRYVIIRIREAR